MDIVKQLSEEFSLSSAYTQNIIGLIDEGNTIPFIARYRKEMHGNCDDQVLRSFADRLEYLRNLEKRKTEVADNITAQGKMTDEITIALFKAQTLTEVEDIYRPYKQKKKTRASVAKERGLEPLADIIFAQETKEDILSIAKQFVDEQKEVADEEQAIEGACDIIAEIISDDAEMRKVLREFLTNEGEIVTTLDKEKPDAKTYDMYADYREKINKIPSHRVLAINRGEKEDCLKVAIEADTDAALTKLQARFVKKDSTTRELMLKTIADAYDRLIFPSLSREARSSLTEMAQEQAIKMFKVNLKPLLMQPPLKNKTILAVDPAYRTGCKIAVIDKNGNVLDTAVVYPTPPQSKIAEANAVLTALIKKYGVDVISIGNGTASKESEIFVANLIKTLDRKVSYAVVNEAGASVYSASKLGAEEFPQFDVSLRSAVSIARRLLDPLAELIKIDVKSIGVGQYQHDMPQSRLTEVLNGVVEDCVNSVGVDINTASPSLLSFVSGLNAGIAKNIVEYRKNNHFTSRKQLLKIPKLGERTFTQCAGFLRITDGDDVLDNTAVHPESYEAVNKLLGYFNMTKEDIKNGNVKNLREKAESTGLQKVADSIGVGVPTLNDIIDELIKPGRDVRDSLPIPVLRSDLLDIKDLKAGMELDGVVRNVIDFGVFVDIGVHQDGLVHISEIAEGYISHPSQVLSVGETVHVKVLAVDIEKNKISLTMKTSQLPYGKKQKEQNGKSFNGNQKPKEKQENLDDALKRLASRFGYKK
jgi:uncharacterized protein